MGIEIERKFLVVGEAWRTAVDHTQMIAQGYLAGPPAARCSVRVRTSGENAFLNIKSLADGIAREEYEYAIPVDEARRMLDHLAAGLVIKRRHEVQVGAHRFEIDEFEGDNHGLIVAEVELGAVDEAFERPSWLGREVSHLARYYNLNLVTRPYALWSAGERAAHDA